MAVAEVLLRRVFGETLEEEDCGPTQSGCLTDGDDGSDGGKLAADNVVWLTGLRVLG